MNALQIPIPRRSFLHGLTALAAAGFMPTALAKAVADAIDDFGNYTWAACVINCGNRCPLRVYTKAGRVIRIETDKYHQGQLPSASDPRLPEGPLDASALVLARSSALSDEACGRTR